MRLSTVAVMVATLWCAATSLHCQYSFLGRRNFYPRTLPVHVEQDEGVGALATHPLLIEDGGTVTVSVPEDAQDEDLIAIYCPFEGSQAGDFLDHISVKEARQGKYDDDFAEHAPTPVFTEMDEHGHMKVLFRKLINMRCDYGFRFLKFDGEQSRVNEDGEGVKSYLVTATSDPTFLEAGPDSPMHVHVALSERTDEMVVQWTSNTANNPTVEYSTKSESLDMTSRNGETSTYTASEQCGAPANITNQQQFRDPGLHHAVRLEQLQPSTLYWYRVGDGYTWSDVFSFMSLPAPGDSASLIAMGDMGISDDSYHTIGWLAQEEDVHAILHYGDISYARGAGYTWERFFQNIQHVAAQIPYMMSVGNHDSNHIGGAELDPAGDDGAFRPSWGNYGEDSGGECGVPFASRFKAPFSDFGSRREGRGSGSHFDVTARIPEHRGHFRGTQSLAKDESGSDDDGEDVFMSDPSLLVHPPWWYSFDVGNMHVVMMSTEHNFTRGSRQWLWLQHDLQSVNRTNTPFVVLTGHRPMYTSQNMTDDTGHAEYRVSLHLQEELEDLLYTHHVNLAIWGHQHSYERSCPVYKHRCVCGGTVHVVSGAAGAELEHGPFELGDSSEWSLASFVGFSYVRVDSLPDRLRVSMIDTYDGAVIDSSDVFDNKMCTADGTYVKQRHAQALNV